MKLVPAVAAGCLMFAGCGPPADPPPSVVLISVDTMRHDFLGVAGAPEGLTPRLDRLARGSIVFENARSTSSWTLPAHMSLFTAQYPESHGVDADGRALASGKRTLAAYLRDRGYRTGGFWSGPYLHPTYGFGRGFEVYEECVNYRIRLGDEGHVTNVAAANMRSRSGVTSPKVNAAAMQWLATVPEGKPYLLFLHYWDPHADYEPPPPYDRFLDDGYTGRITGRGVVQDRRIHPGMAAEDRKRLIDLYRGEIRWTDAWIGRVLRRLEERGDLDHTIVVVTSDHGEAFFEHGQRGHRIDLFDETLRVPMLARFPGGATGGRISRAAVCLVDVFPTIAACLGDKDTADRQGVDLAAVVRGDERRNAVFGSLENVMETVCTSRWKALRRREDDGAGLLYELPEDPGETHDVRADHPRVWEELAGRLNSGEARRFASDRTATPSLDPETEGELKALGYTD